ncbi:hypothetical protein [Paraflavitalea speifideaquila]|uniref:hypothetical protein n=1 Tax=Paraflavitalea speifideaquila TaxID=3076558 RepID=UPI0028F0A954|nr:hypothetical protein [Paraflavitalea speifideiaquila]
MDIKPTNSPIDYARYDLLHFFNLTRPADTLIHLSKTTIPCILSPIWIDYSLYDKSYRHGIAGILFKLLSANKVEYSKRIARWLFLKEQFPGWSYLWRGQKKSIEHILAQTTFILPNSALEYNRLAEHHHHLPLISLCPMA